MQFYYLGGALRLTDPSYVERRADQELFDALREGEYCYVLTARQMGKTSLMARVMERLRREGNKVVAIDLAPRVVKDATPGSYYHDLLDVVGQRLGLEEELEAFWQQHDALRPLQRLLRAVQMVVLPRLGEASGGAQARLVICLDEIDSVLTLPFPTNDLFAAIRECYNRRSEDPVYDRLVFCLMGVATPSELIADALATPFNIGRRIDLTDFTLREAMPLAHGLVPPTASPRLALTLLRRVLYWTGGHPYLTQRLCLAVAEHYREVRWGAVRTWLGEGWVTRAVDRLCAHLFFSSRPADKDENLRFVQDRFLLPGVPTRELLDVFEEVREGRTIHDDEMDPCLNRLRLAGLVKVTSDRVVMRNRIYDHAFGEEWVRSHRPAAELRRQREAYRRGLIRATVMTSVVMILLALLVGFTITKELENRRTRAVRDINRATALLTSGRMGRRVEGLQLIAGARPYCPEAIRLEDHAVAMLALRDLALAEEEQRLRGMAAGATVIDWEGGCRGVMNDRGELELIFGDEEAGVPLPDRADPPVALVAGPLKQRAAVCYAGEEGDLTVLWNLQDRSVLRELGERMDKRRAAFSPDGQRFAMARGSGGLAVVDLRATQPSLRLLAPARPGRVSDLVRWHPGGRFVAESSRDLQEIIVWDVDAGTFTNFYYGSAIQEFCWHPTGRMLAVALQDDDNSVIVEACPDPDAPAREEFKSWVCLGSQAERVRALRFNHGGDLLATLDKGGDLRVWSPWSTLPLSAPRVSTNGISLAFSDDDRHLTLWGDPAGPCRRLEVLGGESRLVGCLFLRSAGELEFADFAMEDRYLIAATRQRAVVLRTKDGMRMEELHLDYANAVLVSGDGRKLLVGGSEGLFRYDLDSLDAEGGGRVNASRTHLFAEPVAWVAEVPGDEGRMEYRAGGFEGVYAFKMTAGGEPEAPAVRLSRSNGARGERQIAGLSGSAVVGYSPGDGTLYGWDVPHFKTVPARPVQLLEKAGTHFALAGRAPILVAHGGGQLHLFRRTEQGGWGPPMPLQLGEDGGGALAGPLALGGPEGRLLAAAYYLDARSIIRFYELPETPEPAVHPLEPLLTLRSPDDVRVLRLVLSDDGKWLTALCKGQLVQLWNLKRLELGLESLGLRSTLSLRPAGNAGNGEAPAGDAEKGVRPP